MVRKTRSKKENLNAPPLTKTNRGLLFSSYTHVKNAFPPVKKHKIVSETLKHFSSVFGGKVSMRSVRMWVKRWQKNGDELTVAANRPPQYNSKRKRLSGQISGEFKKGKTCNSVAFEQFEDRSGFVSACKTTVYNTAKDLGLKPAAAKKRRIVTFTPHHAKAAKTVCEANLQMEEEMKSDGLSWSECFVFEDEKGWKGSLSNGQIIWVPAEDAATSNIQQDCNR